MATRAFNCQQVSGRRAVCRPVASRAARHCGLKVSGPSLSSSFAQLPSCISVESQVRARLVRAQAQSNDKRIPDERQLNIWRNCQAVCFDVDCTILQEDSLDLLAKFLGKGEEVECLTSQAMDGTMNLSTALDERLHILDCSPQDLQNFTEAHPPLSRITPGAIELIKCLQARNVEVYLISGSFRELILPLAKLLNIPARNVMANRMNWHIDDETGLPCKLAGFDPKQAVSHNKGKPSAIRELRRQHPYQAVVMVGDGITDLEAVEETGAADLFIGYGGVVERKKVLEGAEWYVYDHRDLLQYLKRSSVAVIGSGAWACAAARMVAQNTASGGPGDQFVEEVKMWVYEEEVEGRKLTEVINEDHENVKYFPGVQLPPNLVAVSEIEEAVRDADVLVLCVPHQFMRRVVSSLKGKVKEGAIAVSLVKGMRMNRGPAAPQLISQLISSSLHVDCSVLMGANVAEDIGREQLSEATIGYTIMENGKLLQKLFQRPYFLVNTIPDVVGAEMAGTLKNIVALGAGFIDGLGYGANTKAAILRQGLAEMRDLAKLMYPNVRDDTFLESCGVADLIATCYGGRNRNVSAAWAQARIKGEAPTWHELEESMLKGQKLQGVLTAEEVYDVICAKAWHHRFPLFVAIHRIAVGAAPVQSISQYRTVAGEAAAAMDVGTDDGVDPFGVGGDAIDPAARADGAPPPDMH